jgi:hypothetical protein
VVFLSWPRLTFYSKTFVNRSLRKNEAFRTAVMTYKRHKSMQSDVSSTEYEGNIYASTLSDQTGPLSALTLGRPRIRDLRVNS